MVIKHSDNITNVFFLWQNDDSLVDESDLFVTRCVYCKSTTKMFKTSWVRRNQSIQSQLSSVNMGNERFVCVRQMKSRKFVDLSFAENLKNQQTKRVTDTNAHNGISVSLNTCFRWQCTNKASSDVLPFLCVFRDYLQCFIACRELIRRILSLGSYNTRVNKHLILSMKELDATRNTLSRNSFLSTERQI